MIYFDFAATTLIDPEVLSGTMDLYKKGFSNSGSLHPLGERSHKVVAHARAQLASLIGADSKEIIFTSGATEANNLAILGAAEAALENPDSPKRVITFATEHKCVLQAVRFLEKKGFEPVVLPVNSDGTANLEALKEALNTKTLLVSVMKANNELGTINDIDKISPIVKQAGALLHVDMAQALGKIPVSVENVDLASFSAHKMYGPQGIGALYARRRPRAPLLPRTLGGGQERGLRSGTLPVALVYGFGKACELAQENMQSDRTRLERLQKLFEEAVLAKCKNVSINAQKADRLPGYTNISLPEGFTGAEVAKKLGEKGIMSSFGSACTAGAGGASYVLEAIGQDKQKASRGLRLTAGRPTTDEDYRAVFDSLVEILG